MKKRMTYFENKLETISRYWGARGADFWIEAAMQENGSDFNSLVWAPAELDKQNEKLLEKYERYEYLSGLDGWKVVPVWASWKYSHSYIGERSCFVFMMQFLYHLERIFVIWLQYSVIEKMFLVIGTIIVFDSLYFKYGFVCLGINVFFVWLNRDFTLNPFF